MIVMAFSRWREFRAMGRTLFVMASSQAQEESADGPGRDPDEPSRAGLMKQG